MTKHGAPERRASDRSERHFSEEDYQSIPLEPAGEAALEHLTALYVAERAITQGLSLPEMPAMPAISGSSQCSDVHGDGEGAGSAGARRRRNVGGSGGRDT